MGGKTRVFGKKRVFSTKPGFPGRTSVLLANPGYFKGLEAQGIYIYIYTLYMQWYSNLISLLGSLRGHQQFKTLLPQLLQLKDIQHQA